MDPIYFPNLLKLLISQPVWPLLKLNVTSQIIQTGKLNTKRKSIPKQIPTGEMFQEVGVSYLLFCTSLKSFFLTLYKIPAKRLGLLTFSLNLTFIDVEL